MDKHSAREIAALYKEATGTAPNEVARVERAVLIETHVGGEYSEHCPNGYRPILMSRTPEGWTIFDTGDRAGSGPPPEGEGLMREGAVLYVKTGPERSQAIRGIRALVGALRDSA